MTIIHKVEMGNPVSFKRDGREVCGACSYSYHGKSSYLSDLPEFTLRTVLVASQVTSE